MVDITLYVRMYLYIYMHTEAKRSLRKLPRATRRICVEHTSFSCSPNVVGKTVKRYFEMGLCWLNKLLLLSIVTIFTESKCSRSQSFH